MARPKIIKKAPGLGKEELGKMLDISLSCRSEVKTARESFTELYTLILNLNSIEDMEEVQRVAYSIRQEAQFVGMMLEGADNGIDYLIKKSRYLIAYVEHKQLLWDEQQKQIKTGKDS